eukprot:TRINITY_DN2204_c0_g1_i1.p1 TRINITY_DN2204_c0_g1~~TRINITY_DN2204_c0_g1_i1.p1  ORF type:complete len:206 (+),score=36.31 TRINITY_DN2204_c0_g1_i1:66-620(+)
MADKSTAELRAELDALRTRLSALIDIVEIKLDSLDERERRLKELQEQMTQAAQAAKEKIKLDVGGSLFATSKATLLTFANSFFHAMLSSKEFTPDPQDGAYFIDRNPKYFGMILDFMRSGQIDLEELGQKDLRQLRDDADFYQLDALAAILETVHHEEKDRNAAAERAGVASNIAAIDSILEKM